MPREFTRSRRIEEAIQRILGQALTAKARDPRLSGVIITDVRVARDFSVARVYYTRLAGSAVDANTAAALLAAMGFLRSTLAGELRIRQVPELRFFPDKALAHGQSMDELIARAVSGTHGPASADPSSEEETP
jgi:ribosome-binding factor A